MYVCECVVVFVCVPKQLSALGPVLATQHVVNHLLLLLLLLLHCILCVHSCGNAPSSSICFRPEVCGLEVQSLESSHPQVDAVSS